jgi:hypothetical protein
LAGYALEAKTGYTRGGYEHSTFHLSGSRIALLRHSGDDVTSPRFRRLRSPRGDLVISSTFNRQALCGGPT